MLRPFHLRLKEVPLLLHVTNHFSQWTGEVSVNNWENFHYLFEKVTQIFCCKFKSTMLLLVTLKKSSLIM